LENIHGCSGSLMYINTIPVSIIFSKYNNVIESIPFIYIKLIMNRLILYGNVDIKGIIFKANTVIIKDTKNNTEQKGFTISDTYDITYTNMTDITREYKFRKNDIIYKINNTQINKDGTIYDENLDYNIY